MIKIGNILIDPDGIDTILQENVVKEYKGNVPDKIKNAAHLQIIYKSGVVKNFAFGEIGMSYNDFINKFEEAVGKEEDRKMLKLMAALNSNNG